MENTEKKTFTASAELCNIDGKTKFSNRLEIAPDGSVMIHQIDIGQAPDKFCNADDNEYWVEVPAAAKDALLFALLKDKYAGNPGAVTDFEKYLIQHGIPQKTDFWVSFD